MQFPEPSPAFSNVELRSVSDSEIVLASADGLMLEISYLAGAGWSLELRYDLLDGDPYRQPFTGRQAAIEREVISCKERKHEIELSCNRESLTIERASGKLSLRIGNTLQFESLPAPFSRLGKPAEIPEGLNSPKVLELADHPNFPKLRRWYRTQMVRFEYPTPTGQMLGLAGATGELNRRGYRFELYNTDRWMHYPNPDPMYQSWPILIHRAAAGTGWIGVFHDNPSRTIVDTGAFAPDRVTFESIANNTRVYLVTGDTLAGVGHRLSTLLGVGELPPLWAFGYQQCRFSYLSTDAVRRVLESFAEHDIPLDAVYFDIDYMDGYRVFTRDGEKFGDMRECLEEIHRAGRRAVCIVDPGVKIDPGYLTYDQLLRSGRILKNEDGTPFEIKCWPDKAILPDFSDPKLRSLWAELQRVWLESYPFDGVWNDMNEPANFDGGNEKTSRSFTHRAELSREFNLYGFGMARASREGWERTAPGKRGVIITRSGYPGVQQHAVIWHGDNHSWWEHLRLAIDTCITYALAGAYYTGPDVPGFSADPPDDLAVRFFQLGSLVPLFRGHSAFYQRDKEPYSFGAEARIAIRESIRLRYSLLREWYSGFERAVRTRMQPLVPVLDESENVVRDEFLLFDKFLAAPVIGRDDSVRSLYLPPGRWFRLGDTKHALKGNHWISEKVTLESIPLFVREGSIVTRNTPARTTHETLAAEECFEIYPDSSGNARGYWFNDDGNTISDPAARREDLIWSQTGRQVKRVPAEF